MFGFPERVVIRRRDIDRAGDLFREHRRFDFDRPDLRFRRTPFARRRGRRFRCVLRRRARAQPGPARDGLIVMPSGSVTVVSLRFAVAIENGFSHVCGTTSETFRPVGDSAERVVGCTSIEGSKGTRSHSPIGPTSAAFARISTTFRVPPTNRLPSSPDAATTRRVRQERLHRHTRFAGTTSASEMRVIASRHRFSVLIDSQTSPR